MKRIFIILIAVLVTASMFAQSPEKMSYQAVIRDATNNLVTSHAIGMRVSILQSSVTGTEVYKEIYNPNPQTNANGLVTIEIGSGIPLTGVFANINWKSGPYFIKTETDPSGGTNYTITGTSQLLSVPYALHAKTAESVSGTITETDPVFTAWDKSTGISITESQISDLDHFTTANETDPVYGASVASGITATDTTSWNNKLDSETDPVFTAWDKTTGISITESQISDLDHFTTADETDPVYVASVASGITATDTTNWNNKLNAEVDGSVTNELQALSISNDTIYLSNGNFVKLPTTSETDPLFVTSVASSIATTDTARWNNKQNQLTSGTGISIINNIISAVAGGTHYLGEEYLDGIIFYLYIGNDGLQHGLVVSKVESTGNWGDEITVVGADRTEDGLYNTNMMSASSTAKIWVQSLGTDWYLPSQDEFSLLWHNRFHVNKTARTIGSAIITNGQSYWTSTEYDVSHAFYYAVAYGWTDYSYYSKSNNCRIRAIRSF